MILGVSTDEENKQWLLVDTRGAICRVGDPEYPELPHTTQLLQLKNTE